MIKSLNKKEFNIFFDLMGEVEMGRHFELDNPGHVAWLNKKIDSYYALGARFFGLSLDDGTPVGFATLLVNEKLFCANNAELLDIGVYPEYRRQDYGSQLLKHAEQLAVKADVYCLFARTYAADRAAISFYGHNGYAPVAVMPDLNGPGDEGEIFIRKLLK